jgi:hypothetical protein
MSADRHATRFGRMLELSMTSFRYCQLPPVSFEHPNHVTYLHVTTISEEKNPIPRFAPRIIEFMRSWQPNAGIERRRAEAHNLNARKHPDKHAIPPSARMTCSAAQLGIKKLPHASLRHDRDHVDFNKHAFQG